MKVYWGQQSPFISLCMYLNEEPEYKKETAMLIEEFLKQRIEGIKNQYGVKATQTFPKLLFFLDEDNNASLTDSNTIIYGHNMKNGAMFANIKKFADHDYFINHPEVYIYLPDGSINVYSVYSTKIIDATSDYYLKDIDYASYVANAKSSAKQSRDVDTQNGAPLLLLSTCYAPDTTTRSVLFARLEKNVK